MYTLYTLAMAALYSYCTSFNTKKCAYSSRMTNKISPTLTTLVRKENFLQQRIIIPLYQKQIEVIHHTCEMHAELIQEC